MARIRRWRLHVCTFHPGRETEAIACFADDPAVSAGPNSLMSKLMATLRMPMSAHSHPRPSRPVPRTSDATTRDTPPVDAGLGRRPHRRSRSLSDAEHGHATPSAGGGSDMHGRPRVRSGGDARSNHDRQAARSDSMHGRPHRIGPGEPGACESAGRRDSPLCLWQQAV